LRRGARAIAAHTADGHIEGLVALNTRKNNAPLFLALLAIGTILAVTSFGPRLVHLLP
jgi:hypothetical protein